MGYKLKRATIWREKPEWHPGVKTLAYFPLKTDQLDATGNYTLSATGTQQTVGYQFNTACSFSYTTAVDEKYFGYWVNVSSSTRCALGINNYGAFRLNWKNNATSYERFVFKNSGGSFYESSDLNLSYGTRYHIAYSIDNSGNYNGFVNGTSVYNGTQSFSLYTVSNIINNTTGNIILSDIIIESEPRTATQVSNYFNQTKGNYGYTPGETMEELQLRPTITPTFEYSYDFKGKTSSQITTDGWTYDNTPSFDSDGMYYSSRATRPRKVLWENLNDAKKVTQTYGFKTSSSSNALRAGVMTVGLNNSNGIYIESNNNQQIQLDGSAIATQSASKSNGTYTETIVFDFENKTYDATGYFTASGSLTDAQITQIKTSTGVQFIVAYSGMRLQTVSVTVEY